MIAGHVKILYFDKKSVFLQILPLLKCSRDTFTENTDKPNSSI